MTASTSSETPIASARKIAADRVARGHLPRVHRRGQHVVDVAVEARLEDRRRVVRVGRLDHRHRDQPGHDEHLVVDPLTCLMRPPSDRPNTRMNSIDEITGASTVWVQSLETRSVSRLASQPEPDSAGVAHQSAIAFTYTSGGESAPKCSRSPSAVSRAIRRPAADQRDLLAQLLGLLEVVRGEEDRGALGVELPDVAPQLRRSSKSTPAVGSSRITSRGRCMSARASSSLRRWPPESLGARTSASRAGRTRRSSRRRAASRSSSRSSRRGRSSVSRDGEEAVEVDVLLGQARPSGAPRASRAAWPKTAISPSVTRIRLQTALISVVLPAPFGPSRPKKAPAGTRDRSPRARRCRRRSAC